MLLLLTNHLHAKHGYLTELVITVCILPMMKIYSVYLHHHTCWRLCLQMSTVDYCMIV